MGGKPNQGTKKDKRLKKNKNLLPNSMPPNMRPPVSSQKHAQIVHPSPNKGKKGSIYG